MLNINSLHFFPFLLSILTPNMKLAISATTINTQRLLPAKKKLQRILNQQSLVQEQLERLEKFRIVIEFKILKCGIQKINQYEEKQEQIIAIRNKIQGTQLMQSREEIFNCRYKHNMAKLMSKYSEEKQVVLLLKRERDQFVDERCCCLCHCQQYQRIQVCQFRILPSAFTAEIPADFVRAVAIAQMQTGVAKVNADPKKIFERSEINYEDNMICHNYDKCTIYKIQMSQYFNQMQQFDIDYENYNLQGKLQYLKMRNRQRRRKALLLGLIVFSICCVSILLNQYQDQGNMILYSQNTTANSTILLDNVEANQTLLQIEQIRKLLRKQFEGTWSDQQNTLSNLAEAGFYQISHQNEDQISLSLSLIEGHFLENYSNQLKLYLNYSYLAELIEDGKYHFINVNGSYRKTIVYQIEESIIEIIGNITLRASNLQEETLTDVQLYMDGCFRLLNGTQLTFTSELELRDLSNSKKQKKKLIYSIIESILNIVQFISCLKLMCQGGPANQFSPFTFVFLMVYDAYLGIVHTSLEVKSKYYLIPSFIEFILIALLKFKLTMFFGADIQNVLNTRREIFKSFIKFYFFPPILALLLYYFIYYNLFLVLANLYLVPQIIHVAYRGSFEFDKVFVFGLLATILFVSVNDIIIVALFQRMPTSYMACKNLAFHVCLNFVSICSINSDILLPMNSGTKILFTKILEEKNSRIFCRFIN